MISLLKLAAASLKARAASVLLTLIAVAVSVALFVGVEKTRSAARNSFDNTISGAHLVVGAPSGDINLLLYAVFRIGNATNDVTWETFQDISTWDEVEWAIPISLGDSHEGYRVVGTDARYFQFYRYGDDRPLRLAEGRVFESVYEVVLGAEVADALDHEVGSEIVLTHGTRRLDGRLGEAALHDDKPFVVVGILERTGTPVDRSLHAPLEGITAIHIGWESGFRDPNAMAAAERLQAEGVAFDLTPKTVTAFLLKLKRETLILRVKRQIDQYRAEPMLAVIPALALKDLWEVTGIVERALIAVSAFVIAVGLVSILVSILTSLNERRREMSILRAVGARPRHIFVLLLLEATLVGLFGALLGVGLVYLLLALVSPWITATYGIVLPNSLPGLFDLYVIAAVTLAAFLIGLWPAWRALSRSLSDGLSLKV